MQVRVINKSKNPLPAYATAGASGMDLRANIETNMVLVPMQRVPIPTGIYIELPVGYEAQVRSRSGLTINKGLIVANSPGTIDADYRGEIIVLMINLSQDDIIINHGDRIAQLIVAPSLRVDWLEVKELNGTERNVDRFGSTGIK
jgi:dUTP pyrophosphatase